MVANIEDFNQKCQQQEVFGKQQLKKGDQVNYTSDAKTQISFTNPGGKCEFRFTEEKKVPVMDFEFSVAGMTKVADSLRAMQDEDCRALIINEQDLGWQQLSLQDRQTIQRAFISRGVKLDLRPNVEYQDVLENRSEVKTARAVF